MDYLQSSAQPRQNYAHVCKGKSRVFMYSPETHGHQCSLGPTMSPPASRCDAEEEIEFSCALLTISGRSCLSSYPPAHEMLLYK